MKRRVDALPRTHVLSDSRKEKVRRVLTLEMQSSEESGDESKTLKVKIYPWHSKKYRRVITKLDFQASADDKKTSQRMRWHRCIGEVSDSSAPACLTAADSWVIRNVKE